MRFSWIALPLVFAALVGAGGAGTSAEAVPDVPSDTDYADTDHAVSRVAPPLVALPSSAGVQKLERLAAERRTRADHPPDTHRDARGESAAREARLLGHTIDRAELDFSPELRRAVSGFLSSCTTSCPPPPNH